MKSMLIRHVVTEIESFIGSCLRPTLKLVTLIAMMMSAGFLSLSEPSLKSIGATAFHIRPVVTTTREATLRSPLATKLSTELDRNGVTANTESASTSNTRDY